MMGFKAFHSAQATIAGIETANMIRNGCYWVASLLLLADCHQAFQVILIQLFLAAQPA
jgi:transposase-like protein